MIDTVMRAAEPSGRFQSSHEEGEEDPTVDYKEEIRSILVYIGLVTVILFLLVLVFSSISKCLKMLRDGTTTTKKEHWRTTGKSFSAGRQTSTSSVRSTTLLIQQQRGHAAAKPSLAATLRMLQYREQQLSSVVDV